ncbi:MAG TPA: carboxypeptidase-like regulatory domain-containing protein [Pyrinomonadaceae bacterium]|nr:carboxypeptidase-like regulatory domain-containing protein [Pyrinomonadaceae bacterium]
MRSLARAAFLPLLLAAALPYAAAQAPKTQGTAVITGRVTVGGKGAAGVMVGLYRFDFGPERSVVTRGTTDLEGNYKLTGVPAGRYHVLAIAPAYVGQSADMFGSASKAVNVAEGETVEKIDFPLTRGGVITGRVRDADGSPVIAQQVSLNPVGQPPSTRGYFNANPFMYETDDRGVYRLYGIRPGKYTVSVGESPEEGGIKFGYGGRGYYLRTYHPDATEASKATVIEIGEGTEVTNADITVGRKSRSFVATGRVVDEGGKPVAGVQVGQGSLLNEGNDMGVMGWGSLSDSGGRFRLVGLLPGRYAAFVWTEGNAEGYSEAVKFEVADGDVSGLEIVFRRGASLSGVAVIEGTTDPKVLAGLPQLSIAVSVQATGLNIPYFGSVRVGPDGSFRVTGLRPGKGRVYLASYPPPPNLVLSRVERDGVPAQEIELTPGAHVSGVRVVLEYGSGRVSGQVRIANGPLPDGARMGVTARRRGDQPGMGYVSRGFEVDSRGRFVIEGLPPGEYELTLEMGFYESPPPTHAFPPPVKQTVSVTNGVTSDVNFTFDLNARRTGGSNE